MRDAITALVTLAARVPADALPPFDEALLARELALFPEWCVQREFGITWTAPQSRPGSGSADLLIDSALAQPVVAVHADWMPRNLMVSATPTPASSTSRTRWPARDLRHGLAAARRLHLLGRGAGARLGRALVAAGAPAAAAGGRSDFGECWRALEWMGLQRHLKVLGIFCRLKHRDGKPRYAEDLPRFFAYSTKVALRYTPLKPLLGLLEPLSGARVSAGFTF
jgi:N-acetylmuramate 1-kinase